MVMYCQRAFLGLFPEPILDIEYLMHVNCEHELGGGATVLTVAMKIV